LSPEGRGAVLKKEVRERAGKTSHFQVQKKCGNVKKEAWERSQKTRHFQQLHNYAKVLRKR